MLNGEDRFFVRSSDQDDRHQLDQLSPPDVKNKNYFYSYHFPFYFQNQD
jgi:hypothetical protein